MNNKKRGKALLINMMEFEQKYVRPRYGSDRDLERLEEVCSKKLMFETKVLINPTQAIIFAELDKSK